MASKRIILADGITGNMKHYTYAHILIGESYPFYVGIGTKTKKGRFVRARTNSKHNNFWNCYTKNRDYVVIICSESNDYNIIKNQEMEYISILGKKIDNKNNYLVNITDGGDGGKGIKFSDERINKLKQRYSGKGNPMFGRTGSKNPNAKAIIQKDISGNIVNKFESIKAAANSIKISPQAMSEVIKNNYTSKNHKWEYGN